MQTVSLRPTHKQTTITQANGMQTAMKEWSPIQVLTEPQAALPHGERTVTHPTINFTQRCLTEANNER